MDQMYSIGDSMHFLCNTLISEIEKKKERKKSLKKIVNKYTNRHVACGFDLTRHKC